MPSITALTRIFFVSAACCALFACGKANDQAPALNSVNKHPDTWLTGHRSAYRQNSDQCRSCHGNELLGGITKIDCFNQADLGQCHANGHGPGFVPHKLPFTDGAVHGPEAKNDLAYCQSCHGTVGGPGSNPTPRFNVPVGVLKKGCEECHADNTAHPTWKTTSAWKGHATAGNLGNSCYLCHLTGGTGRQCAICHTSLPSGTIPTLGTCVSCHANPPASGNHAKHNALAGVTDVCATCHTGAGSGTAKHDDGTTDVVFAGSYNAKSGTATRDAQGRCVNVSCHGGVTTPAWGGSLSAGCLACHTSGTAQFNSYKPGNHDKHVDQKLGCTDCHDMSKTSGTAGHYSGLGTTGFELSPAATIRVPGSNTLIPKPSCNPGLTPTPGTYSVSVCHADRSW